MASALPDLSLVRDLFIRRTRCSSSASDSLWSTISSESSSSTAEAVLTATSTTVPDSMLTQPSGSTEGIDVATAPSPTLNLLTVPQELQDTIFDYAYPKVDDLKHISHEEWDICERGRRKRDASYLPKSCPTSKVNTFMVSKRYFVVAAKAYVQNQVSGGCVGVIFGDGHYTGETGIVKEYLTVAALDGSDTPMLALLPNLRDVTVELDETAFEVREPVFAWRDVLSEEQLRKVPLYKEVLRCRSLRGFRCIAGECFYAK